MIGGWFIASAKVLEERKTEALLEKAVKNGQLDEALALAGRLGRCLRVHDELEVIMVVAYSRNNHDLVRRMENVYSIFLRPESVRDLTKMHKLA